MDGVDDAVLGRRPRERPVHARAGRADRRADAHRDGGPGVTGTYEGVRAVWYDSTHDHESSPSALSAQVVFANQTRNWAKPAGAPGANYDKWRVYCRSVDLNETTSSASPRSRSRR
jgi:hypothetical protein